MTSYEMLRIVCYLDQLFTFILAWISDPYYATTWPLHLRVLCITWLPNIYLWTSNTKRTVNCKKEEDLFWHRIYNPLQLQYGCFKYSLCADFWVSFLVLYWEEQNVNVILQKYVLDRTSKGSSTVLGSQVTLLFSLLVICQNPSA